MTKTVSSSDSISASKSAPSCTLQWAFKAHERFLDELSPEVRHQLGNRREDAYAIVYGRTQVGKSTLILSLMGLSPESIFQVSTVLRGGRTEGNSSTAVPMEYHQSDDPLWHIHWNEKKYERLTDSEAKEKFRLLREEMEDGHTSTQSNICVVKIPMPHFAENISCKRRIRILDLPGVEAANPIERKFVERIAENLVPNADLILLVGKADDLSFLSADHLILPGITDWQYTPNRFRVVTTYSFTPDSVQEFARNLENSGDPLPFRKRLIDQLRRYGPIAEDARNPNLYFPIEIGNSWRNTDLKNTSTDTMIKKLLADLRNDIIESMTPVGRLMGAVDAHIIVTKQHKIHIEKLNKEVSKLENAKATRKRGIDLCEKILKKTLDKLHISSDIINSFDDFTKNFKQYTPTRLLYLWDIEQKKEIEEKFKNDSKRNTTFFLYVLDEQTESLKSYLDSLLDDVSIFDNFEEKNSHLFINNLLKNLRKENSINVNNISNIVFSDFRSKIDKYWTKEYFFTGKDSDYAKDINIFLIAHTKMVTNIIKKFEILIEESVKKSRSQMQKEKYFFDRKKRKLEYLLKYEGSALTRINSDLLYLAAKKSQMENKYKIELNRSKEFENILVEEYRNTLDASWNNVTSLSDTTAAFEALVLGASLPHARQSVWARIDRTTE